jgi:hypothetical protein
MKFYNSTFIILFLLSLSIASSSCSEKIEVTDFSPKSFDYSFEINSSESSILNKGGKVTLGISSNNFATTSNKQYNGKVLVKIKEAFSPADMMISGLSTLSFNRPLETDGMFYISLTDTLNEKLKINKDKPLTVNISAKKLDVDMKLYDAEIVDGEINWINPKRQVNLLEKAGFENLSFKPENFERDMLNIDRYADFNRPQLDSLYINLYAKWVVYADTELDEFGYQSEIYSAKHLDWPLDLNPMFTSFLKNEKFENTWVNTKAFEQRIQSFLIGQPQKFFMIYMDNIDRPLYYSDSLAMNLCGKDYNLKEKIRNYFKRKEDNITNATKLSISIRNYFRERFLKNEAAVRSAQLELKRKYKESISPTKAELEAITVKIQKREAHRLPQYGFQITSTGWKNVDKGITPKDWNYSTPEILVENSEEFTIIRAYLIFPAEKALIELDTRNGKPFSSSKPIPIRFKYDFIAAAIGFDKEENLFFDFKEVNYTDIQSRINLSLSKTSKEEINSFVSAYSEWNYENNIAHEISITSLERRVINIKAAKEIEDMERTPVLMSAFFPILDMEIGEALFNNNCSTCHTIDGSVLAAPSLNNILKRWPLQEIVMFSRNPKLTCELGFPNANVSANKWTPAFGWMQNQATTEAEILNIINWIENGNNRLGFGG